MSNIRRAIFMLVAAVAFLLPAAQPAQAKAWFSPSGNYWWSVYGQFCRNGAELVARHWQSDTPDSVPGFVPETISFSAYQTTTGGSQEPQKRGSVPVGSEIATFGLLVERHAHPLIWTDDEMHQTGYAYIYGQDYLTWPELPVGTTVAVKMTQLSANFFVGSITDCRI